MLTCRFEISSLRLRRVFRCPHREAQPAPGARVATGDMSAPPGGSAGWVYDAHSGFYHNPNTGVYFDQQRGAYHVQGRWVAHAEYTAMAASLTSGGPRHVVHPTLSRGGLGERDASGSANLVHAPAHATQALSPEYTTSPAPGGHAGTQRPGGWGAGVPAYADADAGTRAGHGGFVRSRRGAPRVGSHDTKSTTPHRSNEHADLPTAPPPRVNQAPPTPLGDAAERGAHARRQCAHFSPGEHRSPLRPPLALSQWQPA